jgi:hypothetical protein
MIPRCFSPGRALQRSEFGDVVAIAEQHDIMTEVHLPPLETLMPRPKKETISKLEAMRQAVGKLGQDAPLVDLLKFIKQTYGITLDRALAYNYKSLASSKPAKAKRRGRKPGSKPAASAATGGKAGGITLADIQEVKALADRLGAEKVSQLAAVLAK